MPLQLVPYNKISGINHQDVNSAAKVAYDRFGGRVILLLNQNASIQDIAECTFMANKPVLQKLLGPGFTLESIHSGRVFPGEVLRKKIGRKRRICILQGVTRFLIIQEITPKK